MFWEIFSVFIESEESFTSLQWHWMRNALRNMLCVYWRVVHFFRMILNEKCFEKYALCLFRMKSRSLFQNDTDEKCFEKYSLRLLRMNSHSLLQNDTEWEMFWEIFSVFIESEEPFTSLEWHWMRNVLSNILCVYWEWRYVHFFRITLNEKSFEKYSLCLLRVKIRSLLQNNTEWEILWEIFSVCIESEEPFTSSE